MMGPGGLSAGHPTVTHVQHAESGLDLLQILVSALLGAPALLLGALVILAATLVLLVPLGSVR